VSGDISVCYTPFIRALGAIAIRKIKCKIVSIYGNIFVFLSVKLTKEIWAV